LIYPTWRRLLAVRQ